MLYIRCIIKEKVATIIIFFSIAKFDQSDSYTSKALRLRVNPKNGDFDNKNINILEVQRNEDSHKSKLKVTTVRCNLFVIFFLIYIILL